MLKMEQFLKEKLLSDGNAVIEISDNGQGIDEEVLQHIFEPFFTTKEVGKGTGLGLSISYGIIKECGGNIRVAPMKGEGARFIITFPIEKGSRKIKTSL